MCVPAGFFGLAVVAVSCSSCNSRSQASSDAQSPPSTSAASVAFVTRGAVTSYFSVAGEFLPYQEVDLHAKVSGYIRRINVDIGDRVRVGQVIATLEVPELNAQVVGAQAQVRHSQSEINRSQEDVVRAQSNYTAVHAGYTRLVEAAKQRPGLVAQQELDDARARDQDAEAQISAARATLDATKQQLGVSQADQLRVQTMSDYSVVTSPFNGVVTKRYADTGSLIQAGTSSNTQAMPVVRIAQSDLLRLRMPIPETDVQFIKDGGEVMVRVQAIGQTLQTKIARFTRALDSSTRTMLAEVDIPNPKLTLSPGMFAETRIVLQQHKDVLSVPSDAVVKDGDTSYVLVVNASSQVEKQKIRIGIEGRDAQDNARTEVISGSLQEKESVIVSGQTNFETGQTVRPQIVSQYNSAKGGNE